MSLVFMVMEQVALQAPMSPVHSSYCVCGLLPVSVWRYSGFFSSPKPVGELVIGTLVHVMNECMDDALQWSRV